MTRLYYATFFTVIAFTCSPVSVCADDGRPVASSDRSSPGAVLGTTWQDEQYFCSATRCVHLSTSGSRQLVHHAWTWLPSSSSMVRYPCYRVYDIVAGGYDSSVTLYDDVLGVGGYIDLAVTEDNRAVLSCTHRQGSERYRLRTSWDSSAGAGAFGFTDYPPDSVNYYELSYGTIVWPRIAYVEGPNDTVLHILGEKQAAPPGPEPLHYFRRVGSEADPSAAWDYPPRIVDSIYAYGAYQIAARPDGRVVVAWVGNVPCEGDPDTVSGLNCREEPLWDNDVYLQCSNDNGVTWLERVNVTRFSQAPESAYRAHSGVSTLFDSAGVLHILWAGAAWPRVDPSPEAVAQTASAIFHWSEDAGMISPVHITGWNQTVCGGGIRSLNIAYPSLAECRGRLYAVFVQFNDLAAGVMDDCASPDGHGFPTGAANGDLYVAVSADGGLTWDNARNLTSTRTPGCDPTGVGGPCASEDWPTVTSRGSNVPIDPALSGAEVVVPVGSSDPGWYLDIQYVEDFSPGSALQGEGTFVEVPVRWFRLACVDPLQYPELAVEPDSILYPKYARHCTEVMFPVEVSNLGTATAEYAVAVEESTGPPGWLAAAGFAGTIPPGTALDTGYAVVNAGGLICVPGSIVRLTGRLRFDSNDPASPHYVEIAIVVADTVCAPSADTVATACLALQVFNDGGCGARGLDGVSMDYSGSGDCDPEASIYLADASPVIVVDTMVNWSTYGCDLVHNYGLVPLESVSADSAGYQWYRAATTVRDSSLIIESEWYAPSAPDTCTVVIQRQRVYATDGLEHTVTLGQIVDWDIPSDTGVRNGSDTLTGLPVIFQYGAEYGQDPGACQDNDRRMGAVFPLVIYRKVDVHEALVVDSANVWFGAQTRATGEWVNGGACGFDAAELEAALHEQGRKIHEPAAPESAYVDLHTLVTYVAEYQLGSADTLVVYSGYVTIQDGDTATLRMRYEEGRQWFCEYLVPDPPGCGCCRQRGDFNHDAEIKVSDLTGLIAFLFRGGPGPVCFEEADATGDGQVKVSDLTLMVAYLFRAGPPPAAC